MSGGGGGAPPPPPVAGRWIQEKPDAQRRNMEQIREMSGILGHISARAGKQREF